MTKKYEDFVTSDSTSPVEDLSVKETVASPSLTDSARHVIKDSISSIKESALRFFSGTVLSRISGMVRDIILAYCFGSDKALSALFVAFRLSHLLRRLFGEGALQSAFIPLFENLRKESPERAFRFYRDVSALLTLFLAGFALVSMLALGLAYFVFPWSERNLYVIFLAIIMMPSIVPICLFGVNSSLLQCQKQYFTPGIAPAYFNIVIAIGALFLSSKAPAAAMPYLSVVIVIGCAAQWISTFIPSIRHLRANLSGKMIENIQLLSQDVRKLAAPLSLGLLGVGASQINNAVDALFAWNNDVQGPANLWFGLRLFQLPLALFGIAVSSALLPPLSRAIQAGNKLEYTHFLNFAIRRVAAFLLPCSIAMFAFGTHIVNVIYGHGAFHADSVFQTTACLQGYICGLLPMGCIIVMAPACYAHKDFRTPTIGAILSLSINFFLGGFMIYILGWKAPSVAFATSISAWVNVLYIYKKLVEKGGQFISEDGSHEFFKVALVSIAAGIITWIVEAHFFFPASFFYINTQYLEILPTSLISQALAFGAPTLTFLLSLFVLAWLVKAEDLSFSGQKKTHQKTTI
jgi:putative peptidoglycan lipid II flippase